MKKQPPPPAPQTLPETGAISAAFVNAAFIFGVLMPSARVRRVSHSSAIARPASAQLFERNAFSRDWVAAEIFSNFVRTPSCLSMKPLKSAQLLMPEFRDCPE